MAGEIEFECGVDCAVEAEVACEPPSVGVSSSRSAASVENAVAVSTSTVSPSVRITISPCTPVQYVPIPSSSNRSSVSSWGWPYWESYALETTAISSVTASTTGAVDDVEEPW